MKNPPKLKVYFSDFFNVEPESIKNYGAFNISLINDLPLFVDPFLIFNNTKPEYQDLHEQIVKYVRFLKLKADKEVSPGLIKAWYHFPEVKENWLGFSQSGNSGRGLGKKFADSLKHELTTIFKDFGNESHGGTHLGKLTLIKGGVGKDNISDFTCNLIKGFLAKYTETFAQENIEKSKLQKFHLDKVSFNYETETWTSGSFMLPKFNGEFILLSPTEILTKDDAWISHQGLIEDFSEVISAVPNSQLRAQIDNYFKKEIPDVKPTKKDYEAAAMKAIKAFPFLLNTYVLLQESRGAEAAFDNIEKINAAQEIFVRQLQILIDRLSKTNFYETASNSYEEAARRVNFLKQVIENQDGYRIFYLKGKPIKREADLQIMFKLTWFAAAYSFDSEVNNGRGPADFMVSYGSADKTIIEFKLASNKSIEQTLVKQAEIYSSAARATHPPLKVILYFSASELTKINRILDKTKLRSCKDVILIDATPKESASKATD